MLVLKAFVNYRQIDEIHIQNTKDMGEGFYEYTIRLPKGDWTKITHKRSDGWRELAVRALEIIGDKSDFESDQFLAQLLETYERKIYEGIMTVKSEGD